MKWISGVSLMLFTQLFLCGAHHALTAQTAVQTDGPPSQVMEWSSGNAQHIYGLPDAKAKDKGTLTVSADGLSFTGKASRSVIPLRSIMAVSSGNERVELWGIKGRLLRMAIPNGGGLAAATVMHHKVNMLTVEFSDDRGAYHGAVFVLSTNEANKVVQSFARMPVTHREPSSGVCENGPVKPRTVLVATPNWDQVQVPAAYRALMYEHLIERLRRSKEVDRVYRDGEIDPQQGCPQYTVHLSITGFKPGSQVARAATGPVGMFAGTTQMMFDTTITDASGKLNLHEQTKATVRGESESVNVTDGVAKKLTKQFAEAQKKVART